jgi:DNA invertase Pin-like site-specific DNA recombinase
MVAVAELEAGMIAARTKAALKASKERGTKLGGIRRKIVSVDSRGRKTYGEVAVASPDARARASASITARALGHAQDIGPTVTALQAEGITSLRAIATALNEAGIPTARGNGQWSAVQVSRVLERL